MPRSLAEYESWSLEKKIGIYKRVIESDFFREWSSKRPEETVGLTDDDFDAGLAWLPLSPLDMLRIDMLLRRYEIVVPKSTYSLHLRWIAVHFGTEPTSDTKGPSARSSSILPVRPGSGP
jgi:hypothetical protein